MMEETIDNVGAVPREVSADAGYYSAKAVGELYALGVIDPFVAPEQTRHGRSRCATRAPRSSIPSHLSPRDRDGSYRPSGVGSATADANCGAGIRPDQAGPGIPAVPAAGTGEGERPMVADLHRPQPAQTVPLGSICTGKHGSMGQPNASGTFAEVVSTALLQSYLGAGRGNRLVVAIHWLTRKHR